ncbi:MAG: ankyrin repeat domain-containing protein [Bdellovibrionales bacterium]|nr:ankyrin repeat domain-containing protein [Bdellovibrionales bacterium]
MEITKLFIEKKKADVNAKDNRGQTPLHYASESCKIKLLKESGGIQMQKINIEKPLFI